MKEYRSLLEKVTGLRRRLEEDGGGEGETITALDVERVAEVIFKKDNGLVKEVGKEGEEKKKKKEKEEEDVESEDEEKRPAKKRKVRKGSGNG